MRYSAEELARLPSSTDWARVDATPPEEVERQADADEGPLPETWKDTVMVGLPPSKDTVKLEIDRDVLAWFRETGDGYQARINNVLRAFVDARRQGVS